MHRKLSTIQSKKRLICSFYHNSPVLKRCRTRNAFHSRSNPIAKNDSDFPRKSSIQIWRVKCAVKYYLPVPLKKEHFVLIVLWEFSYDWTPSFLLCCLPVQAILLWVGPASKSYMTIIWRKDCYFVSPIILLRWIYLRYNPTSHCNRQVRTLYHIYPY